MNQTDNYDYYHDVAGCDMVITMMMIIMIEILILIMIMAMIMILTIWIMKMRMIRGDDWDGNAA